jgi:predicted transcriptional regulator
MKHIIIFAAVTLGLISTAFAYPIRPRPLRQLVIESQYIIVGYVIKTYDKENNIKKENGKVAIRFGPKIAQIVVLEILQGQIKKDTIEIEFNTGMICPEPDKYLDNTYVISFIDKDKDEIFQTHALSYGAKTLKLDEIKIYKNRILEIQQLLKIKDENTRFDKTVEWLLKCAENPVTRWEGVAELSLFSAFWSHHFCDEQAFLKKGVTEETCRNFLSKDQKNRYKKVLFTSNELPEFNAVDLVYKDNESEVDDFLLDKLKKIKEEHFWIANEFMKRLKHKNEPAKMSDLLKKFNELQFDKNKRKELKEVIDTFISLVEKPAAPFYTFPEFSI